MDDSERLPRDVADLLRHVSATILLPGRGTAAGDAQLKSPGAWVTPADLAAEAALTEALGLLTPGAVVVGEERASAEPGLLDDLGTAEVAWIIDPLDGTRHYADGSDSFGVMVGMLERSVCSAAWIHLPVSDRLAHARRGVGAWLDGRRVRLAPPPADTGLRGGLLTRFFPEPLRARADAAVDLERTDAVHKCAARRYVALLEGEEHFAVYWRTLPWDHLPGALIIEEAGGRARRFDGSPYALHDHARTGLLVASDTRTWDRVRRDVLDPPAAD